MCSSQLEKRYNILYNNVSTAGDTRNNLACIEGKHENYERAAKHYIIAANLGCDAAMTALRDFYRYGKVKKEDFEAALRGHQAAVDAMKSEQRETAEKYLRRTDALL